MRDYAFLVIRKHGSPIHFTEVAKQIEKLFKKKAHVATTHNELIKDPRFVLVGRGLYAFLNGDIFLASSKMSSRKFSLIMVR
jgi:DNA-directed RNA polymerase delta subunit